MKNLVLATLTTLAVASSASAGGITFSLPNLIFPPVPDVTVSKECLPNATTSGVCMTQE